MLVTIAGFNLSINEYCDSAVSKSLGLGIDRLSFRYLSSSTVKGKRIVLNDEVDVFINAMLKKSCRGKTLIHRNQLQAAYLLFAGAKCNLHATNKK